MWHHSTLLRRSINYSQSSDQSIRQTSRPDEECTACYDTYANEGTVQFALEHAADTDKDTARQRNQSMKSVSIAVAAMLTSHTRLINKASVNRVKPFWSTEWWKAPEAGSSTHRCVALSSLLHLASVNFKLCASPPPLPPPFFPQRSANWWSEVGLTGGERVCVPCNSANEFHLSHAWRSTSLTSW